MTYCNDDIAIKFDWKVKNKLEKVIKIQHDSTHQDGNISKYLIGKLDPYSSCRLLRVSKAT